MYLLVLFLQGAGSTLDGKTQVLHILMPAVPGTMPWAYSEQKKTWVVNEETPQERKPWRTDLERFTYLLRP